MSLRFLLLEYLRGINLSNYGMSLCDVDITILFIFTNDIALSSSQVVVKSVF